jgi:dienelactone hydrolase
MRKLLVAAVLSSLLPSLAAAKVKGETVEYKHGDTVLEGYLAWDDAKKGPRPAVIVVHEWKGPGEYTKRRAEQLAALGYVAFAADIYGKGVRPTAHEEAAEIAGMYRKDRALMRARVQAALDRVKQEKRVDAGKIAAIGYCFGGTAVLELARSGADVDLVASFHGALETPVPAKEGDIKATVAVFHGAEDASVNTQVPAFRDEMRASKADWVFVELAGALHGFTVKENTAAYNEAADRRSWEMFQDLLAESFK